MHTTPAIEQSLTQGKWLERRLWQAVAVHGGRFGHCQVACPLPLDVHSRISPGVKLDAGTRRRQRLISTFGGVLPQAALSSQLGLGSADARR